MQQDIRQFGFKEFRICILLSIAILFVFSPFDKNDAFLHDSIDVFGSILLLIGAIGRFYTAHYFHAGILNTKGPYSIVRHPRCLTAYIAMIGLSLISARIQLIVALPIMAGFIFNYIVNRQENLLILIYGEEYREYQKNVPRIIPNFSKYIAGIPRRLETGDFIKAILEVGFWIGCGILLEGLELFGL